MGVGQDACQRGPTVGTRIKGLSSRIIANLARARRCGAAVPHPVRQEGGSTPPGLAECRGARKQPPLCCERGAEGLGIHCVNLQQARRHRDSIPMLVGRSGNGAGAVELVDSRISRCHVSSGVRIFEASTVWSPEVDYARTPSSIL